MVRKRIAVIERAKCINGSGCPFLCAALCPVNRTGKECVILGSDSKPIISEALCIGCGICPQRCPAKCISIINLPENLKQEPIHRFGENQFALFSLPIPLMGKVVGIIGKNGIGKSTAIKILAGVFKPNLGKLGAEASYDELIGFFKGTEMQNYLEKVKKLEISVSYKPQNVDLIPKSAKGCVRDLLSRVDEKNRLLEIAEVLDIKNIFDTDISKISGGELQRVAIAAAVLKKANLYIFDEPTSYLDIKQRLKISQFIRSLANESTGVLVIEHDLIALDYMADVVHIMYGKEGVFGVVSLPKSTRAGINTYLEGYIKEENMRFRDKKITFEVKAPFVAKKHNILASWPEMAKSFGRFVLVANSGLIYKKEIVGVLGENGIGKTTFVKMLAGVENPDNGKVELNIKISYKPQYIASVSDELVYNVLADAVRNHQGDIITPLNIEPLLEKQINQLSGGELQRVAIAEALSRDAQLVLLDEPSAYLDVEQRLILSKIIANIVYNKDITVLVVDHDLLFLDYLSERLMVFSGKPTEHGVVNGPFDMEKGMNMLLKEVDITLRRDETTGRPRINKGGSVKDREQKLKGKYYYA